MHNDNLPIYDMAKLERIINLGKTNPFIVHTQQGDHFVVKHKDNTDGIRVLINEYFCYNLAKLLDIPIPDAALIKIDESIIDADDNLKKLNVKSGLHFGSKLIKRGHTNIQPPIISLIVNKEDIPSIILFDQIIYNNDRTNNPGNIIVDLKEKKLKVIDHSHPFKLGAIWDNIQLMTITKEPICLVREFQGKNYKVLLKYVNGNSPFNKILQILNDISKNDIKDCFAGMPDEWEINDIDKNSLIDFIWHRINKRDEILELLQVECPDWKGGDLFDG